MQDRLIDLDHAATTRPYAAVLKVMEESAYGNPSSTHSLGVLARRQLEAAGERTMRLFSEETRARYDLIYTSGGTEANNLALIGYCLANRGKGSHLITTMAEHASVLSAMRYLEKLGFTVTYLPVGCCGHLSLEVLLKALREETILVSCMLLNNELGAVNECGLFAAAVKARNPQTAFHMDAVQAAGKWKIPTEGMDLISVSAHKFHGPKGVGALLSAKGTALEPLGYGGGQNHGLRPGTENVAGIAGMGEAARIAMKEAEEQAETVRMLTDRFKKGCRASGAAELFSRGICGCGIMSLTMKNIRADTALAYLDAWGICCSAGSACHAGSPQPSHVLLASGLREEEALKTIRISLGGDNTEEDIDALIRALLRMKNDLQE